MTEFFKVSGSGNDFIALVEPKSLPKPEQIRAWCQRGSSLGADGVFILTRRADAPEAVGMEHFNADGGRADLCVNGTRCAARLAFHHGWANSRVTIHTGAGEVVGTPAGEQGIRLDIPFPTSPVTPFETRLGGTLVEGWLTRVGVPHLVLPWADSLSNAPVDSLGAALVGHPAVGKEGANINFVHVVDRHHLEIRTYERGVNAETLACGSGSLAAAQVMIGIASCAEPPLSILTAGGERLEVGGEKIAGELRSCTLSGNARIVAQGTLHSEADRLPSPARWSLGSPRSSGTQE
ncbi:MAG: diaminopimelate epimerase [Deltaproteobacteria bacterium]|nr:diaminopimelate epimerase [Deltaproteobacteria bacterium]